MKARDLKVGMQLEQVTPPSKYGKYTRIEVKSIKETKSGRLSFECECDYLATDGEVRLNSKYRIANGAVSENYEIDWLRVKSN